MTRLAVAVLFGLGVAPAARAEDDAKKVMEALQGEWKFVSFKRPGNDTPKDELANSKIVIAGDKFTVTFNNRDDAATFTVDPKGKPPTIDIAPTKEEKERPVMGIYKLEKDTLTICFGPDGADRPTEFKAGKKASLMVLERVKK